MNLFNYLMNKNDKEIVDNNHLLEYLLNAGKLTTITGTELNIIAKKTKINELIMTKESTQETTNGNQLINFETLNVTSGSTVSFANDTLTASCTAELSYPSVNKLITDLVVANIGKTLNFGYKTLTSSNSNASVVGQIEYKISDGNNQYYWIYQNNQKRGFLIPENITSARFIFNIDNKSSSVENTITIEEPLLYFDNHNTYEPYTGGIASPNPDYPMEVETVSGDVNVKITGKNLAKNFTNGENGNPYSNALYIDFDIKPSTTYTFSFKGVNGNIIYRNNAIFSDAAVNITCNGNRQDITLTTVAEIPANQYISDKGWVVFRNQNGNTITPNFSEVQVEKGSTLSSYEQYKESIITLPLNDNEIVGIGDYKDEYIIDKTGHCWLNKKIEKIVLDGTENWERNADGEGYYRLVLSINNSISVANDDNITRALSNYFVGESAGNVIITNPTKNMIGVISNNRIMVNTIDTNLFSINSFKTWLSTHNTDVYYVLETPQLIDLNYNVDLRLFKGVNIISNSDDMTMVLKYYS